MKPEAENTVTNENIRTEILAFLELFLKIFRNGYVRFRVLNIIYK